jgi:hypothetical protein
MEFGQTGHWGQYMGADYVRTELGWNVRHCRPAVKGDNSYEICRCELCSTDCHYSAFYCGRMKQAGWLIMMERAYWKHRDEAVSKREMAKKEIHC